MRKNVSFKAKIEIKCYNYEKQKSQSIVSY